MTSPWSAGGRGVDDLCARLSQNDTTLTSLTILAGRRFGTPEVEALCNALQHSTTLLELRAGGRPLDAAGAAAFSRLLAANCTLRLLCVGGSDFGSEGAAALAKGLAQNQRLQELDLAGPRGIGPEGAEALAEAIARQQSNLQPATQHADGCSQTESSHSPEPRDLGLRALDLSGNPIGDAGACALASHASTLERLLLSACGLGCEAAAMLGEAVSRRGSRLRHLDLSGNQLGPDGADTLARSLTKQLTAGGAAVLEDLNLAETGLADAGAAGVIAAAAALPSLRHLNMSKCGLTGDTVEQAFEQRPRGNCLASLVLSDNALSSAGVSALVGSCGSLISIDLSGNERPIDAEALTVLTQLSSLERVSLFAGRIGDGGVACISERAAERCWPALQHLDLGACDLSLAGVQQIVTSLLAGGLPSLQVLSLAANPVAQQSDELEQLLATLHKSRQEVDVAWRGM